MAKLLSTRRNSRACRNSGKHSSADCRFCADRCRFHPIRCGHRNRREICRQHTVRDYGCAGDHEIGVKQEFLLSLGQKHQRFKRAHQHHRRADAPNQLASLSRRARNRSPKPSKLHMRPDRSHKHRPAVAVISGVHNVLSARRHINSPPNMRGVIGFQNIFPPVIQLSVAD